MDECARLILTGFELSDLTGETLPLGFPDLAFSSGCSLVRESDDTEGERLALSLLELREGELFALAESSFLMAVTWAELSSSARIASTDGSLLTSIESSSSTGSGLGLCGFVRLMLMVIEALGSAWCWCVIRRHAGENPDSGAECHDHPAKRTTH